MNFSFPTLVDRVELNFPSFLIPFHANSLFHVLVHMYIFFVRYLPFSVFGLRIS